MTPQAHLDAAERLLDMSRDPSGPWEASTAIALTLESLAHSCIAIGDLLGAPHSTPPAAAQGG